MEAKAQARFVRVTPQKARRVVDVIRGRRALEAVDVLRYAPQGAAETVRKIVDSAIANARYSADELGERDARTASSSARATSPSSSATTSPQ